MGKSFNLVVDDEQRPVEIVNLTPHPVTLTSDGESVELPPCKNPARLQTEREPVATLNAQPSADGESLTIPVVRESSMGVEHLPPEDPNTILLVSRLTMDAHPNREDLMCPTDLERDSYGQITGAKALVSSRAFAKPAPDHLVVPFGTNPMPVFQSIVTLKPKKVTALISELTWPSYNRMKEVLLKYEPDIQFDAQVVNHIDDAKDIREALGRIKPSGWALSYVGGTKAMSAHSRLAYDTLGDGRPGYVSLIQNRPGGQSCIVSEDGNEQPLVEGTYSLTDIAKLHGYKFSTSGSIPTWSQVEDLMPTFQRMVNAGKREGWITDDDLPDERTHKPLYEALKQDLERQSLPTNDDKDGQPSGFWFEALIAAIYRRSMTNLELLANVYLVPYEVPIPSRAEKAKKAISRFTELDLVLRDGWSITLVSCTVDRKKSLLKTKLMEAQQRARQFGGDHTHAIVVSLADKDTCTAVKEDVEYLGGRRIAVYGQQDVLLWLAGKHPEIN